MKWLLRIASLIVGVTLLTLGQGMRQAAENGEMSTRAGQIGLLMTFAAYAMVFIVWFVWQRTKISRGPKRSA